MKKQNAKDLTAELLDEFEEVLERIYEAGPNKKKRDRLVIKARRIANQMAEAELS